jgi:hypothetical protein
MFVRSQLNSLVWHGSLAVLQGALCRICPANIAGAEIGAELYAAFARMLAGCRKAKNALHILRTKAKRDDSDL